MTSTFKLVHSELQKAMRLAKCRKCGCMRGTLENLKASLPSLNMKEARGLSKNVNEWLKELEPIEYPCFGCAYCIPPEAMTKLTSKFPSFASSTLITCDFEERKNSWPHVAGEYTVLDKSAPVAVSVLASTPLEEKLAQLKPTGLCIIGKTETENIGIDKIVKNVITNPALKYLIIAGKDSEGHQAGKTLLALWENGVDNNMRIIGSAGRRPILKNVSVSDVNRFRKQIEIDNQIGCKNVKTLSNRIKELSRKHSEIPCVTSVSSCGCNDCHDQTPVFMPQPAETVSKIKARKYGKEEVKLDKAGYFVIIPSKKDKTITVEHYSYNNKLLRTIEGKYSRDIYLTIIFNNWLTDLSHAAYLGKELEKAELSIKKGFKFVQDGA
jgi:tetrahydromethanopterin S-methyltransferase subunit A